MNINKIEAVIMKGDPHPKRLKGKDVVVIYVGRNKPKIMKSKTAMVVQNRRSIGMILVL
jgi:hypothetical protein